MKKVVILYQALTKRRIQIFKHTLNPSAEDLAAISRLDGLMSHLRRMPFQVDEMASNLYDLDEDLAELTLNKCINEANAACTVMHSDWSGNEDAFSEWLKKWTAAMS